MLFAKLAGLINHGLNHPKAYGSKVYDKVPVFSTKREEMRSLNWRISLMSSPLGDDMLLATGV